MHKQFFVHGFTSLTDTGFSPQEYSMLKFGSDDIAKKFGYSLAQEFFNAHSDVLMANRCVVIPSPYNHVENAATVMTRHFVNKLNSLLVQANGEHVEFSIIHRKVSYISDYGFLSKEKRKGLIDNDKFYLNKGFYQDKLLIFIDDVNITGTHEDKLKDILKDEEMQNDCFFLYLAKYFGDAPDIESKINFAGIKTPQDYLKVLKGSNCHIIVRTIKYLLGLSESEFDMTLNALPDSVLRDIYHGSLGEGYYKIPAYQRNLKQIEKRIK